MLWYASQYVWNPLREVLFSHLSQAFSLRLYWGSVDDNMKNKFAKDESGMFAQAQFLI